MGKGWLMEAKKLFQAFKTYLGKRGKETDGNIEVCLSKMKVHLEIKKNNNFDQEWKANIFNHILHDTEEGMLN